MSDELDSTKLAIPVRVLILERDMRRLLGNGRAGEIREIQQDIRQNREDVKEEIEGVKAHMQALQSAYDQYSGGARVVSGVSALVGGSIGGIVVGVVVGIILWKLKIH